MPAKKQKTKKAPASPAKRKKPAKTYVQPDAASHTGEPAIEYTAKIRAIGNSKGVILNNQLMDFAGLTPDQDIVIRAVNGQIIIKQAEKFTVNTDLSTWEKQLKEAIKAGNLPEGDLFEGMANEFDETEW
jgi:antitoxin component of MazEF toxin-antitoxin module